MKIVKRASAAWRGGFKDGKGAISTETGALDAHPYGFGSRFEGKKGTNPEELIGAAHAGCFTMALAKMLADEGLVADELQTEAAVTLEKTDAGFAITHVLLKLAARAPTIDRGRLEEIAGKAKAGCPVSKLLNADVDLEVTHEG